MQGGERWWYGHASTSQYMQLLKARRWLSHAGGSVGISVRSCSLPSKSDVIVYFTRIPGGDYISDSPSPFFWFFDTSSWRQLIVTNRVQCWLEDLVRVEGKRVRSAEPTTHGIW